MRTRSAVLLAALALSGLLTVNAAGQAAAHGDTIHFDISSQTGGPHPQAVATWENDGDPVTEKLAATLSALSTDGRRVGPWQLVAVPGTPSTFTTVEALPAGQWKVTVESGFPALGRAEAEVTVPVAITDPPTTSPTARPVTVPVAPQPVSAAGRSAGSSGVSGWIVAGPGTLLAVIVAVIVARRRRRRA